MLESRGYALIIVAIMLLVITVPPVALYGSGHITIGENQPELLLQIGFVGTALLAFCLIFMGIKIQRDLDSVNKGEETERLISDEMIEKARRAPLPPPITDVNPEGIVYTRFP